MPFHENFWLHRALQHCVHASFAFDGAALGHGHRKVHTVVNYDVELHVDGNNSHLSDICQKIKVPTTLLA